jgi:hypothetical protein
MVDLQDMDEQKSNPLLFPGKASHQTLQRMPNTVIIEAEMDFYLTETTRLVNSHHNIERYTPVVVAGQQNKQ